MTITKEDHRRFRGAMRNLKIMLGIAVPLLLGASGGQIYISAQNTANISNIKENYATVDAMHTNYSELYVLLSKHIGLTEMYMTYNDKEKAEMKAEIRKQLQESRKALNDHLNATIEHLVGVVRDVEQPEIRPVFNTSL